MEDKLAEAVPGPLDELVGGFLAELVGLGYASRSCEAQGRLARHLSRWLAVGALELGDLTEEAVARFVAVRRAMTSNMRSERALVPLLSYLRRLGLAPMAPVVVATTPAEVFLQRFAQHLSNERALAPATVRSYLLQVRPFIAAYPGQDGRWESLTARQVTAYVTGRAAGRRPRSVQVEANALRSLLRWMWRQGLVASPLAEAVGSVAAPTTTVPRKALSPAEVRDLFAALPADGPARLRDEAVLVVMLRLGLRAGEVAALKLEDVDWRSGQVSVHGKRGRLDRVPLPVDVGESLVAYLQRGRPATTAHREVFVGLDAPRRPLSSAAVTCIASRALARAGVAGPGGAHRLRHSAACGVLAAGGGMAEAGQLLRHSSATATAIYAKADMAALAGLARPWPGVGR